MNIVLMERSTFGMDVDISEFEALGNVTVYEKSVPSKNAARIKDADIIVLNKIPVNEELLKDAEHVKLVCLTATGTNNVDFEYTNKRNIPVANVKGYSTESVAQHTFAMLFYVYEHMALYDRYVKDGDYSKAELFSFFEYHFSELYGKTWGIIGLGAIGRRVAEIAEAFGCMVIYYSPSGNSYDVKYERKCLNELLKKSDVVSIHTPLNDKTLNLISYKEFALMKKTAVLLNLARGGIVDEKALYEALKEERIAGAGLDVLSSEPIKPDNPLMSFKDSGRLIITPHIGWGTLEARQRCVDETIKNIKMFLAGTKRIE